MSCICGYLSDRRHVTPSALKELVRDLPKLSGRSDLFSWMFNNRAEFATELGERPDWQNWAIGFSRAKLFARNGKPATRTVARQTWWKVRVYAAELEARGLLAASEAFRVKPVPERLRRKVRRTRPSLIIPDPVVMPSDVRMVEAPKPSLPDDDDIAAKLRRGRDWIGRT